MAIPSTLHAAYIKRISEKRNCVHIFRKNKSMKIKPCGFNKAYKPLYSHNDMDYCGVTTVFA